MVGNPNVVSEEGIDEKGEAGEPEGAKTGFEAVVSEAGAVVWPWALATKVTQIKQ